MAIEENYWAEAQSQPEPVMEEFLPSGLVPNAERPLDMFKHVPTCRRLPGVSNTWSRLRQVASAVPQRLDLTLPMSGLRASSRCRSRATSLAVASCSAWRASLGWTTRSLRK